MDESDDAYKILGVPRTATNSQIKSAYRKLALEHHPDRQDDDASKKQKATKLFSKISNAYEILSDEKERREYDRKQQQQQEEEQQQNFRNSFGRSSQWHDHNFHDPFELFAQVFSDSFGTSTQSGRRRSQRSRDPFFTSDPFRNLRSTFARDFFDDPFFDSPFGVESTGRDGGRDVFSQMRRQMQTMQSQMESFPGDQNGNPYFSSSSSSTTKFDGTKNESVTTRTLMINGKRQTVTERVTVQPDGTTERKVETTGDDDFPKQLPGWFEGESGQLPAIETDKKNKKLVNRPLSLIEKKGSSVPREKAEKSKKVPALSTKKRWLSKKKKSQEEEIEA